MRVTIRPQTTFGPGDGLGLISSSFACMTKVRFRMEFFPNKVVEDPLGNFLLKCASVGVLSPVGLASIFPKSPACLISVSGPPCSSLVGLKCPPASAQLPEVPS